MAEKAEKPMKPLKEETVRISETTPQESSKADAVQPLVKRIVIDFIAPPTDPCISQPKMSANDWTTALTDLDTMLQEATANEKQPADTPQNPPNEIRIEIPQDESLTLIEFLKAIIA